MGGFESNVPSPPFVREMSANETVEMVSELLISRSGLEASDARVNEEKLTFVSLRLGEASKVSLR